MYVCVCVRMRDAFSAEPTERKIQGPFKPRNVAAMDDKTKKAIVGLVNTKDPTHVLCCLRLWLLPLGLSRCLVDLCVTTACDKDNTRADQQPGPTSHLYCVPYVGSLPIPSPCCLSKRSFGRPTR